jgi:hypothetical protein
MAERKMRRIFCRMHSSFSYERPGRRILNCNAAREHLSLPSPKTFGRNVYVIRRRKMFFFKGWNTNWRRSRRSCMKPGRSMRKSFVRLSENYPVLAAGYSTIFTSMKKSMRISSG